MEKLKDFDSDSWPFIGSEVEIKQEIEDSTDFCSASVTVDVNTTMKKLKDFDSDSWPFIGNELEIKQEIEDSMDFCSDPVTVDVNPDVDGIRVLDSLQTVDSSFVVLDPSVEVKAEFERNSEKVLLPSSYQLPDPLDPSQATTIVSIEQASTCRNEEKDMSFEVTASKRHHVWNFKRVITRLGTLENSIAFAEQRGMLQSQKMCQHHRRPMKLQKRSGQFGSFRCSKYACRYTRHKYSRAVDTFFENAKTPLPLLFQIMYCYASKFTLKQTRKECSGDEREEELSTTTMVDWFSRCRKAVVQTYLETIETKEPLQKPTRLDNDEISENQTKDEEEIDKKEWRKLSSLTNNENFSDHIIEYSWRQHIRKNKLDPFEELINAINHVYGNKNCANKKNIPKCLT